MSKFLQTYKFCKNCGKQIDIVIKRDIERKKFCSVKCRNSFNLKKRWENEAYRNKTILAMNTPETNLKKGRKSENHPNWKQRFTIQCLNCGNDIQIFKRKNFSEKFCNRKCYLEYHSSGKQIYKIKIPRKKINCLLCKKEIEVPITNKTTKFCSLRCHNINNFLNMKKSDTSLERKFETILKDQNINYQKQKNLLNFTICDFFIEPNIAIYVDGTYWHSRKGVIQRDNFVNKGLLKSGYKVIRIAEPELENNIAKDKILNLK